MKNTKKAIYLLGNLRLKGFVDDASEETKEGLYWFNTTEREAEGRPKLLVDAKDLKILL